MIPPAELIRRERQRQIDQEGYSLEHDDEHRDGELFQAAMCYYLEAVGKNSYRDAAAHRSRDPINPIPMGWPWSDSDWKPRGPLDDLVRAGALMMAEQGRLERAGLAWHHVSHKLSYVLDALEKVPQPE